MTAPISVIIPAHDEAAVIDRCLSSLLSGPSADRLDVVVACNGCTDDTAERARRFGPAVRVIEVPEASKVAGLNAGDRAARHPVRAYVDADVEVSTAAVLAVADALHAGDALAAAPRMHVLCDDASWGVRAHQRVFSMTDYTRDALVGSGFYALSAAGRARFGEFPPLIADDLYVRNLFRAHERLVVQNHAFVVRAPRTVRALVTRASRAAAGNAQLAAASGPTVDVPDAGSSRALLRRVAADPSRWLDATAFGWVWWRSRRLAAKKLATGQLGVWERDLTTRAGGSGGLPGR